MHSVVSLTVDVMIVLEDFIGRYYFMGNNTCKCCINETL